MKAGPTAADRNALMKGIKAALKQGLWDETSARPTFSRYLSLFTLNPEPMWVYDVHTLQILDANDAAMRRYGYSRPEFLGLTIKGLRPDEDVPKLLELIRDTPKYDRSGPWRHRLKDGSIIQVLITSHAVTFGEHDARLVMAESLTDDPNLDLG
jgi:PAS domain S-box-containing protein